MTQLPVEGLELPAKAYEDPDADKDPVSPVVGKPPRPSDLEADEL